MRMLKTLVLTSLISSSPLLADEITRITADGSLGNVTFANLAMNAAGDYIAVSYSNVYAGNADSDELSTLFIGNRESFVLSYYDNLFINGGGTGGNTTNVTLNMDIFQVKAAINANGDFVLTSLTKLFVGNTRTGEFRHIYTLDRNAEFQTVAINDAGHYLTSSYRNVYAGHIAEAMPSHIISSTEGSLGMVDSLAISERFYIEMGAPRLVLNSSGQFVVLTTSEVYTGSIPEGRAERLLFDNSIGFTIVQLNDAGQFMISSKRNLFRGTID